MQSGKKKLTINRWFWITWLRILNGTRALLTDEVTKKRTDDIFIHEKEVRDLQKLRFGFEGDLYKKRQEMLKPMEDRVNSAAKIVAIRMEYKIVLDKSEGITVMFSKSTLDITGDVEKELGMN